MWRSGVPVKGIYFIPFFGGAAVSKGVAKTRARAAYIAINGPIWGTLLALGCFAAFALGDGERRFLGTLAAWGAFINLFNLLPIFPLDGGRLVASLAHASRKGVPIVAASLVLGGVVAYLAQLELLVVIGIVGLLELGERLAAATYGPALALLARPLSATDHEHFAHHTAFVELERDTPARREVREQLFTRRKAEAEQTPMTLAQAVVVLAGYVALVGVLVAVLYLTADIAGSGSPLDFLR
jgi:membrane-associated protease RseP (regulator of RpoE activity)